MNRVCFAETGSTCWTAFTEGPDRGREGVPGDRSNLPAQRGYGGRSLCRKWSGSGEGRNHDVSPTVTGSARLRSARAEVRCGRALVQDDQAAVGGRDATRA